MPSFQDSAGLYASSTLGSLYTRVSSSLPYPPGSLEKANILIVDDNRENLRALSLLLKGEDYKVRQADSGSDALEAVDAQPPDLILLDLRMPEMNGFEVCSALKRSPHTAEIPILFISASDDVGDKVQGFEAGAADYITKPFKAPEILKRIKHHLSIRILHQQLQNQNTQLQQEIVARQQTEEKYRSMIENAVDGIFQSSPGGSYLSVNQALAEIYGYDSPADLLNRLTDIGQQLYVNPRRREEFIAYMNRSDTVSDFESQVYRADGRIIWISEDVRSVRDATGNLLYYEGTIKDISERKEIEQQLVQERMKIERLLFKTFPQPIAERLKQGETNIADEMPNVTVLFADIVHFTSSAARIAPVELVGQLSKIFYLFDTLADHYGVEKIKTIGDAYMAAGGLTSSSSNSAAAIAHLALAMAQAISQFRWDDGTPFQLRIGINTGSVIAGVIGSKKPSYDLWGDTVNTASRMQTSSKPGRIQATASTYELLKTQFQFEVRGAVNIRGKGRVLTYWLNREMHD